MSRTELTTAELEQLTAIVGMSDAEIDLSDIPELPTDHWKDVLGRTQRLQAACFTAAWDFGTRCAAYRAYAGERGKALEIAINYLMTELWDQNFAQTEIRGAFEGALRDMKRYAAGHERRSD